MAGRAASGQAVARSNGHRAHELHRVDRGGPCVRAARRAGPRPTASCCALGLSNVLGGLSGAMPAGGGTSQTAVNARAGASHPSRRWSLRRPPSAWCCFLAPLIGLMPQATLAAVVIVTSLRLIDPADFAAIRRVRTVEFRWAVAAMLGVIVLGTLRGIVAAMILSMVNAAAPGQRPAVHVLVSKPGTRFVPPEDGGTSRGRSVRRRDRPEARRPHLLRERAAHRRQDLAHVKPHASAIVVLDLGAVPDIDTRG